MPVTLKNKPRPTFDLRIEGMPWQRELTRDQLHQAVESAYKTKPGIDSDLLFVIQENFTGGDEEQFFCMDQIMWEALCESPEIMSMYLNMFWYRDRGEE